MNILLVTIEAGGNIPPLMAIVRDAIERGHKVFVLSEPCMEDEVMSAGAKFVAFKEHFTKTDRKTDMFKDYLGFKYRNYGFENVIFGPAKIVARETMEIIKREGIDVAVLDFFMTGSAIAAKAAGIPYSFVFHMPEVLPGPNRPPGFTGLLPMKGWMGNVRDQLLAKVFNWVFTSNAKTYIETRKEYKLEPLDKALDMYEESDLRIIQTCKEFDVPIDPAPSNVRYTGPVIDEPAWVEDFIHPWPEDNRPLIAVSFSTTMQNQSAAIRNCIAALGDMDVYAIVTVGSIMENEPFDDHDNVKVVVSAPHKQVFALADLVITHAGHGTMMKALSCNVPLLCMPMGRDQNDNAAKIKFHGAGLSIHPSSKPGTIQKHIRKILSNKDFKIHAQSLGEKVRKAAASRDEISLLEQLVAKGKEKVLQE